MDEFFEEPEIIEEHPPRPQKRKKFGGFLDLLSGFFMTGTIGVGLLFVVLFINPQSRLNPLPPPTIPSLVINISSSTPKLTLPPTWTPTLSPTDPPTMTPAPTETPISTGENSPIPTAVSVSGLAFGEQEDSPTSEVDAVHADFECDWPGAAGQNYEMDGHSANIQSEALLKNQPQSVLALTAPNPTQQFLTTDLTPDAGISDIFTPEIQYWEEDILVWSEEFGLDPNLIATVMQIESCGYTRAKSAAGALGIFQVMPHHFKKKEEPYDPDTNAYRGLSWLQKTVRSGGSISMILAGYNAGIARANNPYLDWPDETQRYVNWGLGIYQAAKCGYEYSSALQHWLSKGGAALCERAAQEQQDK
jgi:hypothetical protein